MNRILSALTTAAIIFGSAVCFEKFYHPDSATPAVAVVFPGQSTDAQVLALEKHQQSQLLAMLNTADAEELDSLPGIGSVRSEAIQEVRPLNRPEDVLEADGVGERSFRKLVSHASTF